MTKRPLPSPSALAFLLASPGLAQTDTHDYEVHASTPDEGARFGDAIDAQGGTLIVGARFEGGSNSGAAYVFERSGCGSYSFSDKLVPSDSHPVQVFGSDVLLDGDYAIVGAYLANGATTDTGAVYVFDRAGGGSYTEVQKLFASDGADGDLFGSSLDLEADTLVIGADALDNYPEPGKVYVFERDPSGLFQEVQILQPTDAATIGTARFGIDVEISGNYLAVGASRDESLVNDAGSAYVFERAAPGAPFVEIQKLSLASQGSSDNFGREVALAGDTLLVGCAGCDGEFFNEGRVFVYRRDGGGSWNLVQTLLGSFVFQAQRFGYRMHFDGITAAITAPSAFNQTFPGTAYVFEADASGVFSEKTRLLATGPNSQDFFGNGVAFDRDTVFIGAPQDDDNTADSGTVYGFEVLGLCAAPREVSVASGGDQTFELDAGPAHAGQLHLLLGSASGTAPGSPLGLLQVPLNLDLYTVLTAQSANQVIVGSLGLLDANGQATATLSVPAGTDPGLVGVELNHAFVVFDTLGSGVAIFASNADSLALAP